MSERQRFLVKISGEALSGSEPLGIDQAVLTRIAGEIQQLATHSIEVSIVIGGGNLFRGASLTTTDNRAGLDRVAADQMGMLATIMNGIAIRGALECTGVNARLLSAVAINGMVEPYNQRNAIRYLSQNEILIFVAGTGNPFFTTDSAACLRAIEIEADLIIKATQVDGVYSADPHKYPDAVRYNHLSYDQLIKQNLAVMDLTAICLVKEHNIPIRVVDITKQNALLEAAFGNRGTLINRTEDTKE